LTFALRQSVLILIFILLSIIISTASQGLDWTSRSLLEVANSEIEEDKEESYFTGVLSFFSENNQKKLKLIADQLIVHTYKNEVSFVMPNGIAFTQEQEPVDYRGQRGMYDINDNRLELYEDVEIKFAADWFQSQEMIYHLSLDQLRADTDVKSYLFNAENRDRIFVDAHQAFGQPRKGLMEYQGNVTGRIQRHRPFEAPVNFAAERMVLEMPENKVNLFNNVFIKKQDFTATSYTGEIYLDNYNKKLKYFVLNDDVKVVEKVLIGKEPFERRSFSEKLEGFMAENKIVLTGFPRVFQHQDIIKGNLITLRENSEVIEVEDSNTNFIIGN
jgi:lipopolysaccharide export system protein LptA